MFCTFTLVLLEIRVQCPKWRFAAVPWFCAFPVCCSRIFWMILRWFRLPLLLLVSLLFYSPLIIIITIIIIIIIIIICICIIVSCHRPFFLVLLLNQLWSPPLRLQVSQCSTFRIICDVPSIAVFCSESIQCFPGISSKFFLKLLVTIPVAPNTYR